MSARSGDVFRAPKRDRHGDPIDDDGNPVRVLDKSGQAFVGTLTGIIMGGQSASRRLQNSESSDTSGMIGCLRNHSVKVKHGDRIVIDGVKYEVTSRPEWQYGHSFADTDWSPYYWVDVTARG